MKKPLLPKIPLANINKTSSEATRLVDANRGLVGKLRRAMETAEERGKVYGASHRNFEHNAKILEAMFPEGITIKGWKQFARFVLLNMVTAKLGRYIHNYESGGHEDSIHDIGVYSFIIEDFDERLRTNNWED